ncbi:MAG TPA: UDP-N-acetylmuramoyl-L-alanyl-D-glutamate--2,6-diaminopimelate ligase, partial [Candidatus Cloacimonadota bacterium]|nr:UDP-N-acetylmuramoyl-L-alanyl-D-glutamate--2,6-diaminopimelate ligase [Candidatus Cloacimonadota bacterium]
DVSSEDTFIAIKGGSFDGHSFISDALRRGASLAVGTQDSPEDIPYIKVKDSRKAAALAAKVFFCNPSSAFTLIGITGTNGKTTTSLMLFQALGLMGLKCGWIGTLGYKIGTQDFPTLHTTPDIIQLNEIFSAMHEQGVSHVVMEVSSHALALDRVYGVEFDYCMFSNLTREHLDFHGNMDDYFETKYTLFSRAAESGATSIINLHDPFGQEIYSRLNEKKARVYGLGQEQEVLTEAPDTYFQISNVCTSLEGSTFTLSSQDLDLHIASKLIGQFNAENLALAVTTLIVMGFDPSDIMKHVIKLQPVRGRIEPVPNTRGLGVFIDYAHTPDAISNLVSACRKLPHQRIITVIGAGGNRDKGKRPLMLKAALSQSDAVIVTDDNPRTENPDQIIYDIVQESDFYLPWWIIRNRSEAIHAAIRLACEGDIVLICGKGHETYQEISGVRHDFDDHKVAAQALRKPLVEKASDELILPLDLLTIQLLSGTNHPGGGYTQPVQLRYISTDTRKIKPNSLFVAIKGEHYDGNKYIEDVLRDVTCMAIGSNQQARHERFFYAENPALFMSMILKKYLQMFHIFKIALTGSTGKTSTKEILALILETKAPVLKTAKNENNIIGLAQTILRIEPSHRYGVFELGTNHFGEISSLADSLLPDAGVILNIGPSHLEYFGDEEGVFREKTCLFKRPLAQRFFPADDPRFEVFDQQGISVGYKADASYQITNLSLDGKGQSFELNGTKWQIPYQARHYVINAAFAIALALELKLDPESIQAALNVPLTIENRMQIEHIGGMILIIDCYNANPISMQSALETWHDTAPILPHIAYLGDMLELGSQAVMYHKMIGAMLAEMGCSALYTIGDLSRHYHSTSCPAWHYQRVDELLAELQKPSPPCVVLLKASHGIHLEKLIPRLRGEI